MPNINDAIYEGLTNQVHKRKPGGERRESAKAYCHGVLAEEWRNGRFSITKDLDFEKLSHSFRKNERFDWAWRKIESGDAFVSSRGLQSDIQEALSLSQYGDFVSACVRMGTFEMCSSPDFSPILSLFDRVFVDCVNRDDYTMPAMAEFDVPCVTEDERTQLFGIGDMVKRCRPEQEEKRFGMAIKRNLVCVDPNQTFREMIREQGAMVLNMHVMRQLLRLAFDCYCPGENPYRMCYDGIHYDNYLCGGGPWTNLFYNNMDFDCACQHPAVCALEQLNEDMRNPLTGHPMLCCDNLDIIVTGQKQQRYITELLGPHLTKRSPEGECSDCEINRLPREGWGQMIYSKWIRKEIRDCLCSLYGVGGTTGANLSDAQIDQMLNRTFLAGCFREAFAWQVRWDTEVVELSGTNTEQYHREQIIFRLTWSEWTGPFTKNPWAVYKVFGLPDGVAMPTDCSQHPLCPA